MKRSLIDYKGSGFIIDEEQIQRCVNCGEMTHLIEISFEAPMHAKCSDIMWAEYFRKLGDPRTDPSDLSHIPKVAGPDA